MFLRAYGRKLSDAIENLEPNVYAQSEAGEPRQRGRGAVRRVSSDGASRLTSGCLAPCSLASESEFESASGPGSRNDTPCKASMADGVGGVRG